MTPYGFTCDKCPSRGSREVVGDFVGIPTYEKIELPQGYFIEGEMVSHIWAVAGGVKYLAIGYPDRCKTCNARYQRHKTARECITRMSYVLDESRCKHLKFVTLTHSEESSRWHLYELDNSAAVERFYDWFIGVRDLMRSDFKARAGTDVLECVEDEWVDPIFGFVFRRYHVHQHGIWLMPFMNFQVWNSLKKNHKIGRDKIESIKDTKREDGKVSNWMWQATDYLSKYISKENVGIKRMTWGDVRNWRDFAPLYPRDLICKKHVKSTLDIHNLMTGKKEVCECVVNA